MTRLTITEYPCHR